ncbi:MAG: biopolymer transporter ExbD [Candidatus Aminicenantes bacterium]|nr:biopolymer transporter ExbD [Candidatus Aminicenantes bacterium]MDH5384985.1 biopolymer transporter ExbD [Candidatus Aminicenantes bacterium]MDH5743412.1 biopolymer transporter ExbD [Candidatus Aminicenantes bacterium]
MAISVDTGRRGNVQSEPNVVPLCDVLLVLLIIFMVMTPLIQRGVDVELPTALNTIDMPDNPEAVLYIRRDGSIYLNEQPITKENLQLMLEEALITASERKLYLRADLELEYGIILDLIPLIKEAGIEIVGLIAEVSTERRID